MSSESLNHCLSERMRVYFCSTIKGDKSKNLIFDKAPKFVVPLQLYQPEVDRRRLFHFVSGIVSGTADRTPFFCNYTCNQYGRG